MGSAHRLTRHVSHLAYRVGARRAGFYDGGMSPPARRAGHHGVGRRQAATETTAARIMAAARAMLLDRSDRRFEMGDVARAAGVGRATLYRHFADKPTLVFAVLTAEATTDEVIELHRERLGSAGTGLVRYGVFLRQVTDHLTRSPDLFRLMALVEADYGPSAGAQVTLLYRTLFAGLFSVAAGSEAAEESPAADLSDGQRDGSVRADLDPWAYHAAALASLASLASHVALLGDAVESLYHRTAQELMAEAARGWLRGAAAGGAA